MLTRPSFLIIGAEKAGTTSLYNYLSQHPGIFMPPVKELNHLIQHPKKRSLFQGPDVTYKVAIQNRDDYFKVFSDAPEGTVVGEITHIYLYAPESPGLIHEVLGNPKVIAILRNPVDRAFSQFVFHRNLQLEPLPTFEEALTIEEARIKAGWDPVFHYQQRGFYGEQLSRYYKEFPEDELRIYKFEDFFQAPASSMSDLYGFVGADASFVPDITKKFIPGGDPRTPQFIADENKGVPRPKQIRPATRNYLHQLYAEDIMKTERLTGLNLSDWLE